MAKTNSRLIVSLILILFAVALVATKLQSQLTNPTQQLQKTELVTLPKQEVGPQEITVEADQRGFYLDGQGIDTLNVAEGAIVTLSIHVSPSIGYYGLIFRSPRFPDLKVNAGETGVVEFDGVGDFTITSYKPATTTTNVESEIAVLMVVAGE